MCGHLAQQGTSVSLGGPPAVRRAARRARTVARDDRFAFAVPEQAQPGRIGPVQVCLHRRRPRVGQQAPVALVPRPARPDQPGPARRAERFGRRQRGQARLGRRPQPERDARRERHAFGEPPRHPERDQPERTTGFTARALDAFRRRRPRRTRDASGGGSPPGASQLEQRDRAQAARSRASGGTSASRATAAAGRQEPAVGPVAGFERVRQEQAVEVRDVPADRGIEQVALMRPGGPGRASD